MKDMTEIEISDSNLMKTKKTQGVIYIGEGFEPNIDETLGQILDDRMFVPYRTYTS